MPAWAADIEKATVDNETFRTVLFTGAHLQITVMSIPPGGQIGLEMHGHVDQFLRIEQGRGQARFGPSEDQVDQVVDLAPDWAIVVAAGTWHNVVNTGAEDLRLYSIYAPPNHPEGTVHRTKADADAAEAEHHH